jgi:hypothetical protein
VAPRQGADAVRRAAAAPAGGEEVEERGMAAEHGREGVAAARARSDGWRRASARVDAGDARAAACRGMRWGHRGSRVPRRVWSGAHAQRG